MLRGLLASPPRVDLDLVGPDPVPQVTIRETLDLIVFGPLIVTGVVWMLYLLWMGTVGNSYSEFTREWLSRVVGGLSGVATGWFVAGLLTVHATPAWQWTLRQSDLLMGGHGLAAASAAATVLVLVALALKRLRTKERSPQSAPPQNSSPWSTSQRCWPWWASSR